MYPKFVRSSSFLTSSVVGSSPTLSRRSLKESVASAPTVYARDDFFCKLCCRQLTDPRVLDCFHTFCLTCLKDWMDKSLAKKGTAGIVPTEQEPSEAGVDSINETMVSGNDLNTDTVSGAVCRFTLPCPTCGAENKLPPGGLAGLPPNYVLKHRMMMKLASVKCDICSSENPAISRCCICIINLCTYCSDDHKRQRATADHNMTDIANNFPSVKRQAKCHLHPGKDLSLYCAPCEQVVCRDCSILLHRGHPCEVTEKVAKSYSLRLNDKLKRSEKARMEAEVSVEKLTDIAQRVEQRCTLVEGEVEKFVDSYLKAVSEHAQQLKSQVATARSAKLHVVTHHKEELEKMLQSLGVALKFGEDLVVDGSETEVLTFAGSLVRKLDKCLKMSDSNYLSEMKSLETLNFLPDEKAGNILNRPMFGMVTTQRVSAAHCILAQDGLNVLNDCRQQHRCEVVLLTRDCDGQPICHGGDNIHADARYRDISRRSIPVSTTDRQDGSYSISFMPDSAGNMLLTVSVRGTPVKGSPFPVCVRTLRPHHGTYHCCTFCSSGGKKDITCGCGGQMPGDYKGCGHGHTGHPGRRHWSCCGNILLNSECSQPPQTLHFCL